MSRPLPPPFPSLLPCPSLLPLPPPSLLPFPSFPPPPSPLPPPPPSSLIYGSHKLQSALYSSFINSRGRKSSEDTTAVLVYRVLATFTGRSVFKGNVGGGITLIGSRMDVQGEVVIDGNSAVFGAGIAMSGRSLVSEPTCVSFEICSHSYLVVRDCIV